MIHFRTLGCLLTLAAAAALGTACGGGRAGGDAVIGGAPKGPRACGRAHDAARGPRPVSLPRTGSTVALAEAGGKTLAYVADEDDDAVHVIDVDGAELSALPLGGKPSQLAFLADGRLVVALRDKGQLVVLEPNGTSLETRCAIDTDAEPVGLAITPDDSKILVTSGWGRSLATFDAKSPALTRQYAIALPREPRSVVVSDDGAKAFIAHAVGGHISVVDLEMRRIQAVPSHVTDETLSRSAERSRRGDVASDSPRQSCQGFALAKTDATSPRILAPQVLVDPGDVREQPSGYGSNRRDQAEVGDVAVFDPKSAEILLASLEAPNGHMSRAFRGDRDEHNHDECLLPRAAAYDAKNRSLLVGCFGIDAVVAYDALAASPARAEKHRWSVAAGPSGIAIDPAGSRAVVWSQFERTLSKIPLGGPDLVDEKAERPPPIASIALAPTPRALPLSLALGRILFHSVGDVRISHDGRACASCHPDGRDDALTWATPNGPRRTIMLAGRVARTAPFSWSGSETDLKEHIGITFSRLKGSGGLKSFELSALASYVESLPPPPARHASDGKVAKGDEIFHSKAAGCSSCHSGALGTDNVHHDVHSKTSSDRKGEFNTPSLKFVGGAGPYFHDGRYKTLRELLTDADRKMGYTKHLSTEELEFLEAYLRSL